MSDETKTERFKVELVDGKKDWRSGEPRGRVMVTSDEEVIIDEQDGGEPEDQTFSRDLSWVPDAIERAYAAGLKHGREEGSK